MMDNLKEVKKLGQGAYGTVYLVENETGKRYVLKEIELDSNDEQVSRNWSFEVADLTQFLIPNAGWRPRGKHCRSQSNTEPTTDAQWKMMMQMSYFFLGSLCAAGACQNHNGECKHTRILSHSLHIYLPTPHPINITTTWPFYYRQDIAHWRRFILCTSWSIQI